jgi:hypothetical protein
MKNTRTRTTANAEATAATLIASRWLKFASKIITENLGQPTKLSETVRTSVSGQFQPGMCLESYAWTEAAAKRIAALAIADASQRLNNGEFPEVLAYFKAKAAK